MIETELQKTSQDLLVLYETCFEKRYGVKPVTTPGAEQTILKDLARKLGAAKMREIIIRYLQMEDKIFQDKAHSVQELKYSINKVNIALPKLSATVTVKLEEILACDSCWRQFIAKFFPWKGDENKQWIKCPDCSEKNAPWKYPSIDEFKRNWQGVELGQPSYEKMFPIKDPYPLIGIMEYDFVRYIEPKNQGKKHEKKEITKDLDTFLGLEPIDTEGRTLVNELPSELKDT